jgi:hypothetical protein
MIVQGDEAVEIAMDRSYSPDTARRAEFSVFFVHSYQTLQEFNQTEQDPDLTTRLTRLQGIDDDFL